uniref:Uncharacterized protein AlNc14C201G8696 n=1 Tax=Albugo laibachii Nc14 TaxID=890382 RepID=F0WQN5_9STRA|nr:conserved hypothetical protein [Albugo laibachii Nc14]|eukprot:CCA23644.1 conserved hypothetical protein [Albugo laibachii Nc14]
MDLAKILSPSDEEKQGITLQSQNEPTETNQNGNLTQNAWMPSDSHTLCNGKPNWNFLSQLPAGFRVLGKSHSDETVCTSTTEQSASKKTENNEPFNRLDLLVQADAILMQKSRQIPDIPKTAQHPEDSKQLHVSISENSSSDDSAWLLEEEEYAAALIYFFFKGMLDIDEGTLLCDFLAQQLRCDVERIGMKLATQEMARKQLPLRIEAVVFRPCKESNSSENMDMESILDHLRHVCHQRKLDRKQTNANGTLSHKLRPKGHRSYLHWSSLKANKNILRGRPCIVRTGFVTEQEEMYTRALIECFRAGVLSLSDGEKLIEFLCQALKCTPRELSLKLANSQVLNDYFSEPADTITFRKEASQMVKFIEVPAILELMRQAYFRSLEDAAKQAEIDTALLHRKNKVQKDTSPREKTSNASRQCGVTTVAMHEPSRFIKASRSGPWSKEEEAYSAKLIRSFCDGALELAESTTLRAFLASRLGCNPMRVSKKLATGMIGSLSIPKRSGSSMFVRKNSLTSEHLAETQQKIDQLYQNFKTFDAQKRSSNARNDSHSSVKKRAHSDTSQKTRNKSTSDSNQVARVSKKVCSPSLKDAREFDQNEAHYTLMTGAILQHLHPMVN